MKPLPETPATIAQPTLHDLVLEGGWTARGIGRLDRQLDTLRRDGLSDMTINGEKVTALDSVGALILQRTANRLSAAGIQVTMRGWRPEFTRLFDLIRAESTAAPALAPRSPSALERLGHRTVDAIEEGNALLSFVGEAACTLFASVLDPRRLRLRTVLHHLETTGFGALPIVGLLAFLLGTVVAYQGASQLTRYGADIFVADLISLSMLREFSPLLTAIIVAGRSGSAFTAQIGTMAVTEELDAMRTIGIAPFEQLVLPKIFALLVAVPLLTVYADVLGVGGGMIMTRMQLGIGFKDFLERVVSAVSLTDFLVGASKAPVFAIIIAVVGCFQGFRTHGGADNVGRQTTRSVVHSIFLVIVIDALFSVAFSVLHL